MKIKLFCPHCGRCLGEALSSDETGQVKVLASPPSIIKDNEMLHSKKCVKCKNTNYISMNFINKS